MRSRTVTTGRATTIRQTVLWTGLLALVPLLTYPHNYGLGRLNLHPAMGLLEWGLYFVVFGFALPDLTGSQRWLAAGFTVVYRLTCAGLFSVFAILNSRVGLLDTMAMAMWSYPLTVIPHVLMAPLVTQGLWKIVFRRKPVRARITGFRAATQTPRRQWAPSGIGSTTGHPSARAGHPIPYESAPTLDDAVSYVGEYAGVRMAWLVDMEGLTLAVWQRQQYTDGPDFWAPVSIEMVEFDRHCLSVDGDVTPHRVEVRADRGGLIMEAVDDYWLGVLTDHDTDELIGVRLSQARDMIVKHLQECRATYAGMREVHYV